MNPYYHSDISLFDLNRQEALQKASEELSFELQHAEDERRRAREQVDRAREQAQRAREQADRARSTALEQAQRADLMRSASLEYARHARENANQARIARGEAMVRTSEQAERYMREAIEERRLVVERADRARELAERARERKDRREKFNRPAQRFVDPNRPENLAALQGNFMAPVQPDDTDVWSAPKIIARLSEKKDKGHTHEDTPAKKSVREILTDIKGEDQVAPREGDECVQCWDRKRCVLFRPCKHCVVCIACAKTLADPPACPSCRTEIEDAETIFL